MIDAYDFLKPATPAPPEPAEVTDRRNRAQIFGAESGARAQQRTAPADRAILDRAEICVLGERGGHTSVGRHCPHGLPQSEVESEQVKEVSF